MKFEILFLFEIFLNYLVVEVVVVVVVVLEGIIDICMK